MGVSDTQSYAWILREAFLQTLEALPYFSGYSIRRNRRLPIMTADLPVLGVYLADEQMTPDGVPNSGEIRFQHQARIGFSVIIKNNGDAESERILDSAFWAIMHGLWTNESITNRLQTATYHFPTGTPDNVRFESVMRGIRRHQWGAAGQNNETDTAELQYDATISFGSMWTVEVQDTLDRIVSKTNFPSDHSGLPSDVQQVVVDIELTQQRGEANGRRQNTGAAPADEPAEQEPA
jgi:hypothetical protein